MTVTFFVRLFPEGSDATAFIVYVPAVSGLKDAELSSESSSSLSFTVNTVFTTPLLSAASTEILTVSPTSISVLSTVNERVGFVTSFTVNVFVALPLLPASS